MSCQGVRHARSVFRHGEASTGKSKTSKLRARQIQIQMQFRTGLEGCALQSQFLLVGPAWSPCQQVSGTNDEGSWAAQHFSKYSISDRARRMDSLYHHTCPIAIVKQVIDCLHRVGCSMFSSHVDERLERLSIQYSLSCCQRL